MLTPVFELSQDDDFVVVIIKTPYVKVSFKFWVKVVSCIGVKRLVLFLFNILTIRILCYALTLTFLFIFRLLTLISTLMAQNLSFT